MILTNEKLPTEPAEIASKDEALEIITRLEWELAYSPIQGIGLAAPQIGINKAVAIVRIKNPGDPTDPVTSINLVNPKLIEAYDIIQFNEGCLSFPGMAAKTVRYNEVVIETIDDYDYYSEQVNARRNKREPEPRPLLTDNRRLLFLGEVISDPQPARQLQQLVCVCAQHEFSHLLGLTMFDFKPKEVGRNDQCSCGSGKKNKKCHNYDYYNNNLNKLFNPNYRGA